MYAVSTPTEATRRPAPPAETATANRTWWDHEAGSYYVEHGSFLGDTDFVWGPERLREEDARLLGDPAGRQVLEIGAGSGQCSRWLAAHGATVVATDISAGMVATGVAVNDTLDPALAPARVPFVQCDGRALPFADASFDTVFTAYGVVPFVGDSDVVMREAARVLRPGGRFVFSTTHPVRWAFPDDPGAGGLTARHSYFDRTPYVEQDEAGRATYVEHHRTLGDRVREIAAAGLVLVDLVEPEWPEGHDQPWGGWSPLRGRIIPGTAIFVCDRPS
ncbi:class I SAM-dependent methyltransferase [Terrabacter aerolatus]|uniref:SAM-dependent methyltransferase n=1 Tax=Terrabacter aerolatus TaxID=422442 RepID=A0A512D476_9MICO|nr:SAM-dependent methyltransferase [Terrabacter aerolatus]